MNSDKYFFARVTSDLNLYKVKKHKDLPFIYGERIIINTEFGEDIATITSFETSVVPKTETPSPIHPENDQKKKSKAKVKKRKERKPFEVGSFLRYAGEKDLNKKDEMKKYTQDVKSKVYNLKEKLKLDMQITHIQIPLSKESVVIYYVAKSRVDFRELLISLRQTLRVKIVMRQISVRERQESFYIDPRDSYTNYYHTSK